MLNAPGEGRRGQPRARRDHGRGAEAGGHEALSQVRLLSQGRLAPSHPRRPVAPPAPAALGGVLTLAIQGQRARVDPRAPHTEEREKQEGGEGVLQCASAAASPEPAQPPGRSFAGRPLERERICHRGPLLPTLPPPHTKESRPALERATGQEESSLRGKWGGGEGCRPWLGPLSPLYSSAGTKAGIACMVRII